jgi:hypothetical protein
VIFCGFAMANPLDSRVAETREMTQGPVVHIHQPRAFFREGKTEASNEGEFYKPASNTHG